MGLFTELDSRLFHEGKNYESYKKMGAHILEKDGVSGTNFAVWAPHAQSVSVMTSKTGWDEELPLQPSEADPGIWEVFVPGVGEGDVYRYVVLGADGGRRLKSDPYAFLSELRPANASIVMPLDSYVWNDAEHQAKKENKTVRDRPMAIYEVHLGSWKKDFKGEDDYMGFLNYRDLADQLAEYVKWMGFTHVELMGICEHPFDGSWGYQVTGFYSPNSRHGKPDDLRYLIDRLHQAGIQVILDFVPAHFPKDSYGLGEFDGSPLYESADPLRAEYPEWGTFAFDHGKPEVRSFLISSAFYWIREFHIDALRVDAVAAMLYASFSRYLWRPNVHGGNINLESEGFLKQLNEAVNELTPAYMIAEDSSTIAGITDPVSEGGKAYLLFHQHHPPGHQRSIGTRQRHHVRHRGRGDQGKVRLSFPLLQSAGQKPCDAGAAQIPHPLSKVALRYREHDVCLRQLPTAAVMVRDDHLHAQRSGQRRFLEGGNTVVYGD